MLHAKEDLLPSLVVPHIVQLPAILLDDVLDPASLLDERHEGLMREDSYKGFVLWCCSHNSIDIQVRGWTGQFQPL